MVQQLKKLRLPIDLSGAEIEFDKVIEVEPSHPENDSDELRIPFYAAPPYRPHKDLVDSMKKLRKHALEALGIELADESKALKNWTVTEIKLAGDHNAHKARVNITLAVMNKYTSKPSEIKTGQITMYPTDEERAKYPNADKIAPIVEDIIEEVWSYMNGKHEDGVNVQLALFGAQTEAV